MADEQANLGLVFLNWQTADLTLAAVASARASLVKTSSVLQIVVVDNGSRDDSVTRLRAELQDVELVVLPQNRGFAAGINAGLQRLNTDVMFALNTDLHFHQGALEKLAAALRDHPSAMLACPKLLRQDSSEQAAAMPLPGLGWELTNRSLPRRFLRLHAQQPTVVPSVVGPCMALHRERLRKVGWLDEQFFFFFEETDWCRRINAAGGSVLFVPQAEVVHFQGESANTRPTRARVQFYDSRYRYFRKHHGRLATAALFAGLWLRLSVNLLLYALLALLPPWRCKYRDKAAISATLWLWHLALTRPRWGFEPVPARPAITN